MPFKSEGAKRQYDKLRQRRLRGFLGESLRGGSSHVVPNVVPALRGNVVPFQASPDTKRDDIFHVVRNNVVPTWVSAAPRPYSSQSAQNALDYMCYIAERGYTLDRATGELLDLRLFSQERLEALEEALRATQRQLAALQVDISMQRAEAILDDHLREVKEEYGG